MPRRRFRALRLKRVAGDHPQMSVGRHPDLEAHLQLLRQEFVGASELDFLHASTIVMLRRGLQPHRHYRRFRQLWRWEADHLLRHLSSRWLVSAADTWVDYSRCPQQVATAMAAVLLVNTIKLYETERLAAGVPQTSGVDPHGQDIPRPLFDGLTSFLIGRGDLIANLNARLPRVTRQAHPTARILAELMRRMQAHDTVYSRFMAQAR